MHLAVVPPPDESELPIPSPAAQLRAIKLVGTVTCIPQVTWFAAEPSANDVIDALLATPPELETVDFGETRTESAAPDTPPLPFIAAV